MATITFRLATRPGAGKMRSYTVTGIVSGSSTYTLPAPPLAGSFDPSGLETPTAVDFHTYATGANGPKVTADLNTIANSLGTISFTVYSDGNGSATMDVY
jgi:hypothetical protein